MRIGSPALPARRNGLSDLALRVIVTTLALVIVPVTAVSQQENARLRWEYFYQQRAYPFDRIPTGALQAARAQEVARWPAQFAPRAAAFAATWTPIGPTQIISGSLSATGRLTAIAVHPTNSSIIYVGGAQGGVWKTTNGGTSWSPVTDTQCSLAMGGLAIDPVNPNIVYAGTGEQHFAQDSYYGCGVLRSDDGGATWTQLGGSIFDTNTGGAKIARMVIDPRTAGSTTTTTVLAASNYGLYRSTNSGASWTEVLNTVATDIVVDASTNPTTMYVGGSLTTIRGVHKSTDGGATWTKLTSILPTETLWRVNLAIAPSAPRPSMPLSSVEATPETFSVSTKRPMGARRGRS